MGVLQTSSFTRPSNTTAYAQNDLVANDTSAASVIALSWKYAASGDVRRVILKTNNATITNGNFNLWLFRTDPSGLMTNGDNGALAGLALSSVISVIPIDLYVPMGGVGGWGEAFYDPGLIQAGGGTNIVYGLLQAMAAYTPASGEIFTVDLEVSP